LLQTWSEELSAASRLSRDPDGLSRLGNSPSLLALAYYIEPQLLIESRRMARKGDGAGALAKAKTMVSSCLDFMRSLREKVESGT
jgi:hypothetical protein